MITETEPGTCGGPAAALAREPQRQGGEVEHADADAIVVSTAGGLRRARRALSCLLLPVAGDRVLLEEAGGEWWVTAVLARPSQAPLLVEVDRPLTLRVRGELALGAEAVAVRGRSVDIAGERVSIAATALSWLADTLDAAARVVSTVAERLSTRARSAEREVEDLEVARVGHFDLRAEHLVQVRARHTILKSQELAKIDAKQIQVG
ncbi:MAG: DUF3540 domain-containing protein [Proteobacteria bacterium]|nr:DUF3540 domain-containing protein [Pseudomonadota bacterium]